MNKMWLKTHKNKKTSQFKIVYIAMGGCEGWVMLFLSPFIIVEFYFELFLIPCVYFNSFFITLSVSYIVYFYFIYITFSSKFQWLISCWSQVTVFFYFLFCSNGCAWCNLPLPRAADISVCAFEDIQSVSESNLKKKNMRLKKARF
jgi:hypothetical protein